MQQAYSAVEIGSGREFAPLVTLPAKYTGIFTRVGKIEVATEVSGATQHLIDPGSGLADDPAVVAVVAGDLRIPQYQDAPYRGRCGTSQRGAPIPHGAPVPPLQPIPSRRYLMGCPGNGIIGQEQLAILPFARHQPHGRLRGEL